MTYLVQYTCIGLNDVGTLLSSILGCSSTVSHRYKQVSCKPAHGLSLGRPLLNLATVIVTIS